MVQPMALVGLPTAFSTKPRLPVPERQYNQLATEGANESS